MIEKILGKDVYKYLYNFTKELWIITTYYNPCGYRSRRENYEAFMRIIKKSGLRCVTVECAFGDEPFTLNKSFDVIQVRSRSVLWQKERLINLAVSWLPRSCKYIAWLDCDVIFLNQNWAQETVEQLQRYPIVQLFETCHRLPQAYADKNAQGNICKSFGAIVPKDPSVLNAGRFDLHGHTGYAWAARRELFDEYGLYEYAIAGSGDHYIAHACFDDLDSPCIKMMMMEDVIMMQHLKDWGHSFSQMVQDTIGSVSGEILHLWHGDLKNRQYLARHRENARMGFNPYTDIVAVPGKPLEWRADIEKPELVVAFAEKFFSSRKEDGEVAVAI